MATKRSEQQASADRKHAVRVSLKFNRVFDYEIVQWLAKQKNKQAAIKEAIRFYLEFEKGSKELQDAQLSEMSERAEISDEEQLKEYMRQLWDTSNL